MSKQSAGRPRPLRVGVVGGGIGGLAAANAMARRGIDVRVFEQAARISEVGAGVMVTPNSRRHLERMGLGPALQRLGASVGAGSSYFHLDGTPVGPIVTYDSAGWNGMAGMHRADLVQILLDGLLDLVPVSTGHRCVGFSQTAERARVEFEAGASEEFDIVIAADGIHSTLRRFVTHSPEPIHSGSVAYRGLIPAERLPEWPTTVSQLWMGRGKHFLVYPVRAGQLLTYIGFVPTDERTRESWSAPGDRDRLLAAFADWDPRVRALLEQVDTTYWWGLYDREPLDRWTNGRLALLGDAAHPMLPHLGQGANQAIEDGVALSVFLGSSTASTAPEALRAYEELRRPRTIQVQKGARRNGRRYDSAREYQDLTVRNAEIGESATFRLWLHDYDVAAAAEALATQLGAQLGGRRSEAT